jgi:signal transduction histidine kinase
MENTRIEDSAFEKAGAEKLRLPSPMRLAAVPNSLRLASAVAPAVENRSVAVAGGDAAVLRGILHDARNVVTALRLSSDLLSEPDVLAEPHRRLAAEIRSSADGTERLVRRLAEFAREMRRRERVEVEAPVTDLPEAVRHLSGLLSALAGPLVAIEVACLPCRGMLSLSEENLTRILVHLVRNAADAMPGGGHIRITVQRGDGSSFFWTLHQNDVASGTADLWDDAEPARTAVLTVEDDGPGIPQESMERIFEPGFSTRRDGRPWPESQHHGLGLSLVQELVEEAGGRVRAAIPAWRGARFEIELPLTNVTESLLSEPRQNDRGEGQ